MPLVNNVFNIRVNNISSNGTVDFGSAIYKGLAANNKIVGGQRHLGDMFNSPVIDSANFNFANDPGVNDQTQSQL